MNFTFWSLSPTQILLCWSLLPYPPNYVNFILMQFQCVLPRYSLISVLLLECGSLARPPLFQKTNSFPLSCYQLPIAPLLVLSADSELSSLSWDSAWLNLVQLFGMLLQALLTHMCRGKKTLFLSGYPLFLSLRHFLSLFCHVWPSQGHVLFMFHLGLNI